MSGLTGGKQKNVRASLSLSRFNKPMTLQALSRLSGYGLPVFAGKAPVCPGLPPGIIAKDANQREARAVAGLLVDIGIHEQNQPDYGKYRQGIANVIISHR